MFIIARGCFVYQHTCTVYAMILYIVLQVSFNLLVGHVLWQSWETGLENQGTCSHLDLLAY